MRKITLLSENWSFRFGGSSLEEALQKADWETVSIPHTWNNFDGQDGGSDYRRGKGWYTYTLNVNIDADKIYALEFLGVNSVADVYVNGKHLGQHRGGYTLFRFDITDYIQNGDNLIAVCADNSPFPDVIPLTADFTFFGGIYREVNLVEVNKIHFSLDDSGSDGIRLTYENSPSIRKCVSLQVSAAVSGKSDSLTLKTEVCVPTEFKKNNFIDKTDFSPEGLVSPSKEIVAEKTVEALNGRASASVIIDSPKLWNGREFPFRYKVVLSLFENGEEVDRIEKFVGFRYFSIHKRKGFFLNGKSYPLRGVNRHQDRENMGWAISEKEHDEDFALIYEIGANAIRLAHYPHHPHFYDLCDKYGLLVWAEIPFVENIGGLQISKLPSDAKPDKKVTKRLLENAKQQMSELILQQLHRPSIFCWSMSNEILKAYKKNAAFMMKELDALVHRLDPERYSAMAVNHTYALRWKSDIKGCNIYPGWYYGSEKQFASQMSYFMRLNHFKGIAASEYGAGSNVYQHTEAPEKPKDTTGAFHPEEWASIVHENALAYFMSPKAVRVWGSFVWNMFDFAVDARNEGSMPGRNDKGLVTYDRKIKKDAFYIYKSYWSREPVVYITSRRFTFREKQEITVKVYSNAPRVSLILNGKRLASVNNAENSQNHVFIFNSVKLEKGKNTVKAVTEAGEDCVIWEY